jgi:hypothetical protein
MKGGARAYLGGSMLLLLALAGCGRGFMQFGERPSWRHEAEVNCLKSGAVKLGAGVVEIKPIEGPGMCGADFPLKVSALGEGAALGYSEDMRPPAAIPNGSSAEMPRWPVHEPAYAPPAPIAPVATQPIQSSPMQSPPVRGEMLRWTPGPPPATEPAQSAQPAGRPVSLSPPGVMPAPDDIPDDAILPDGRRATPHTQPATTPAYNEPDYRPAQRALPPLGPARGPNVMAATPAALAPAATLSCPIVSALDRWVGEGVQPAALHWFGTPVVTIHQIGAYSCREMVGAAGSHISEHAFGDALDVAGFTFADGRKITVKDGWHGTPEEQGFLHDVQLYACETFTTVLAPGYNVFHYDHIHVDLMRRASGRRPCRPNAIPGEVVAARARALYASKHATPAYTGSLPSPAARGGTVAVPGADGYVPDEDEDGDAMVTGSIAPRAEKTNTATPGDDGEADDDVTGTVSAPGKPTGSILPGLFGRSGAAAAGDAAIRAEESKSKTY